MRLDQLSGAAALARPDINRLHPRSIKITDHKHDTGEGTPSRARRRQIARDLRMPWSERWLQQDLSALQDT